MEANKINNEQTPEGNMTLGMFILRLVQGFLIGGGAIIPGVSGGVLCVAFGIYQPMMALIAHPFKTFRTYYKMFIPIILGAAAGFIGLAGAVTVLFEASEAVACFLFAGLVAGTIPSLFKEAGKKGTSGSAWTGFIISLFVVFALLAFLDNFTWSTIEPNTGWYLFSGVLWGLSLIIPGLSSSSILVYMGLYAPMTAGVKNLDFGIIIPLFAGIALTALLLARLVNYVYERNFTVISHIILGVIISSTLLIIPTTFGGTTEAILSILCFFGGFAVAWGMDKFGDRIKKD